MSILVHIWIKEMEKHIKIKNIFVTEYYVRGAYESKIV